VIIPPDFWGLAVGSAATSEKDARALWLCPMKEYFKIMLKQKKQFPSLFDHSQSARAFLEGPQSRTSIKKSNYTHAHHLCCLVMLTSGSRAEI